MKINVTGRTDEVTPGMKQKASEKVAKVMRYYDRITWVDVTLDAKSQKKSVEVSAGLNRGATIVCKVQDDDIYAAIDLAVDKITRQVRRHKEKLKDHRPRRTGPAGEPPVGDEEAP